MIYIEGPLNVIVDAFSRLPRLSSTEGKGTDITNSILGPSVEVESHFFSFHFDDDEMKDCFLKHPPLEEMAYPLNYGLI